MRNPAGLCDPRFAGVREAFAANFAHEGETGAALCVLVRGRSVVDLWGGHTDPAGTAPWREDTLVNVFSVGKGVLAMLALGCVERGELSLDEPVAQRWPAYAAAGKGETTLRMLLAHRAGLPALREASRPDVMYDWRATCDALAAQAPYWEPGRAHGYHVNTWGFLVGEVLRRATGEPVAALLRARLGAAAGGDFLLGAPAHEHARIAHTCLPDWQPASRAEAGALFPPTGDAARDAMIWNAYFAPPGLSGFGTVNSAAWRAAVIPSTNAQANARGIARLYAAFLRDAAPGLRAEATRAHSEGEDLVLGRPSRFGLGFQLQGARRALGEGEAAFGHFGHGGSLGLADPAAELAFAYVTHRPGERFRSPRTDRLLAAVYAAL